ncbi:hypothetical protein MW887_002012 [Aspergillus wentii]|nr:hypothetical protein MW887_002012 [Aspergillus wentii]
MRHVDPAELEKTLPTETIWREFYRLIMYDSAEQRYKLSGIGQRLEDEYFYPPRDSGKAVIGKPTGMETDLARVHRNLLVWWFWDVSPKPDWQEIAVLIHMRCWVLVQQVIGPKVHDHLGLFLAITLMKACALNYGNVWLDHTQDPSRTPSAEKIQHSKAFKAVIFTLRYSVSHP